MPSVSAWQSAATKLPVQTDRQVRELLQACLLQGEQVDYLTAKVAALTKLDGNNRELVAALEAQVAAQTKTIAALKAIDAVSGKVESLDARTIASLEVSLKDAKSEIARLTAKAAFWRRIAGIGLPLALVIGAAVGYAVKH